MKNINESIHRTSAKSVKPKQTIKTKQGLQHDADLIFSKELTMLDAFIEVPLLFFLDTEFNNCYYRLSKYFKVNNPKKQAI